MFLNTSGYQNLKHLKMDMDNNLKNFQELK
jgi:hypothetical protein